MIVMGAVSKYTFDITAPTGRVTYVTHGVMNVLTPCSFQLGSTCVDQKGQSSFCLGVGVWIRPHDGKFEVRRAGVLDELAKKD